MSSGAQHLSCDMAYAKEPSESCAMVGMDEQVDSNPTCCGPGALSSVFVRGCPGPLRRACTPKWLAAWRISACNGGVALSSIG